MPTEQNVRKEVIEKLKKMKKAGLTTNHSPPKKGDKKKIQEIKI